MAELKLYFSLISGDMYYIEDDEINNLDKQQVPLTRKPDSNCKKCYGRFHTGFETIKKYYIPCPKCMRKCVDWEALKESEITVEAPVTTSQVADKEFIDAATKAGF